MNTNKTESQIKLHDVFICYAHKDNDEKTAYNRSRKYIDLLMEKLNTKKEFTVFHDRKIPTGDDWDENIINNLNHVKIAVVFLSNNFFGSKYIIEKEAPVLLYRREHENLKIIPVNIDGCSEIGGENIPLLSIENIKDKKTDSTATMIFSEVQCVHDISKALNDIVDDTEVNKIILKIKDEIVSFFQKEDSSSDSSSEQKSYNGYIPPHKGIYEEKCPICDAVKKSILSILESDGQTTAAIKEKIKRKDQKKKWYVVFRFTTAGGNVNKF